MRRPLSLLKSACQLQVEHKIQSAEFGEGFHLELQKVCDAAPLNGSHARHKSVATSPDSPLDGSRAISGYSLCQVPKMLGTLQHAWAPEAFLVSFKLETDEGLLIRKVHSLSDSALIQRTAA